VGGTVDTDNTPEPIFRPLGHLTTRSQDANLVAFPNLSSRKLDGFRDVPFEIQSERASVGEGGHLALEIAGKCGFAVA
jgi:hypothetical protein